MVETEFKKVLWPFEMAQYEITYSFMNKNVMLQKEHYVYTMTVGSDLA